MSRQVSLTECGKASKEDLNDDMSGETKDRAIRGANTSVLCRVSNLSPGIPTGAGTGYISIPWRYTFEVNDIPDTLLGVFMEKGSVDAPNILNYGSSQKERDFVSSWIKCNLVNPDGFVLEHDHCVSHDQTNDFKDYLTSFIDRGFSVWDVQNDAEMTRRVKFVQRDNKTRFFDLCGRPDFIITPKKRSDGVVTSKADRLFCAKCIIIVQSKDSGDKDIPHCEVELQLYLMMIMNLYGLPALVGFLVQNDGMCRTYKATRVPESLMCEQNDLVHVSYIAEIVHTIWEDGSLGV